MLAADYNTAAVGVGRDLLLLGALSFDVTCSRGTLPQQGMLSDRAFYLSYSKRFDEYDSQVTIADYRFLARNCLSIGSISIHAIMVITTVAVKKFLLSPLISSSQIWALVPISTIAIGLTGIFWLTIAIICPYLAISMLDV